MSDILKTTEATRAFPYDGPNPCPPLTAAERDALKRSIEEDGYIPAFPIVVSAGPACEGQIIDGFNRSEVCAELGIEPVVIHHPVQTELEFRILQIKANLERRQLSTAQRALLAVRLEPLYVERAALRMKAGKAAAQSDQSDPVSPVTQGDEIGKARDLAAHAAGISAGTMHQMKAVVAAGNSEQLLEQISSGQKSIKRAYESIRQVEDSIKSEAVAEAEINETYFSAPHSRDALVAERERAIGDTVRLLMETDTLIRKYQLIAEDVLLLRSRPHTFTGTARRLNEWLGEIEEAL